MRLTPYSEGVAHSSKHRTRLRVPKGEKLPNNLAEVKDAIKYVPGVLDVKAQPAIGSITVQHDDRPDILEQIGEAIKAVAPVLFTTLTAEPTSRPRPLMTLFERILAGANTEGESDDGSASGAVAVNTDSMKKIVPYAFLAAGLYKLLEGETLLAGIGPMALFYWAFDLRWKLREEKRAKEILHLGEVRDVTTKG
jgi:copper chaperone CopZ